MFDDVVVKKALDMAKCKTGNVPNFTYDMTIKVVPENQLSNKLDVDKIDVKQGEMISATELISQMNHVLGQLNRIRLIESKFKTHNKDTSSVVTNETVKVYGLMAESLPDVTRSSDTDGYEREGSTTIEITPPEGIEGDLKSGDTIQIGTMTEVLNKYFNRWKTICDGNKLSYTYTHILCHSNCHASCHGSRSRR